MSIEFHCPSCKKFLRTDDDKAGALAKCPDCMGQIRIPYISEEAEQADDSQISSEWEAAYSPDNSANQFAETVIGETPESTKTCPLCGETIMAAAVKCRFCGEDFREPGEDFSHEQTAYQRPHRGGLLITLMIVSWLLTFPFFFCLPFSIIGVPFSLSSFLMASSDLKEMQAGRVHRSGEGMAQVARILSIIQILIATGSTLFFCLGIIIRAI